MSFKIINIFFAYFIFISSVNHTLQNNGKKIERIKNSFRFILSQIKGLINETSFSFLYEKYNITFNNFRILKPIINKLNIVEEKSSNETFYIIKDLLITFQAETYIQLFSEENNIMEYGNIFFENIFDDIKFQLINDYYIKYYESNINLINYKLFDKLDYFSNFNNKNKCYFYEQGKEPIILKDIDLKLKEIFKSNLEKKLNENKKIFNLLTYDMLYIFDNSTAEFELNYQYLEYIKINKLKTEMNYINFDPFENSIKIFSINITGIYYLLGVDFDFQVCCSNNTLYLMYKRNKNYTEIEFNIDKLNFIDKNILVDISEYKDELVNSIKDIYAKYLINYADYYYKMFL